MRFRMRAWRRRYQAFSDYVARLDERPARRKAATIDAAAMAEQSAS